MPRFVLLILAVIFIVLVATAIIRPLFWLALIALIVLAAAALLLVGVRTRPGRAQRFWHH
jgi:hypothetical protein